jgi:hypothetical protein
MHLIKGAYKTPTIFMKAETEMATTPQFPLPRIDRDRMFTVIAPLQRQRALISIKYYFEENSIS